MRCLVLLVLVLLIPLPGHAQSEGEAWALLEQAVARIRMQPPASNIAFTSRETTTLDGNVEADVEYRFDPQAPAGRKFVLVRRDGKTATADQIEKFAKERAGREDRVLRLSENEENLDADLKERYRFDHWAEGKAVFAFRDGVDITANLDGQRLGKNLSGTVTAGRDETGQALVEGFAVTLDKPFKPNFFSKVRSFDLRLTYGHAAAVGRIVPLSLHIESKISAAFQTFDFEQRHRFGGFELVPEDRPLTDGDAPTE